MLMSTFSTQFKFIEIIEKTFSKDYFMIASINQSFSVSLHVWLSLRKKWMNTGFRFSMTRIFPLLWLTLRVWWEK